MTRRRLLIFIFTGACIFGMLSFWILIRRPLPELREGVVEIPKGWGMSKISAEFFGRSRVRGGCFKVYALISGHSRRLRAGEYQLEKDSIQSLTQKLVAGKVLQYRVTVTEGIWADDIATLLASAHLVDRERFRSLIRDTAFVRKTVGHDAPSLEGYLFPETYFFTKGMPEEEIVRAFVARFKEKTGLLLAGLTALTPHQAMTLASMVEREAAVDDERPVIAAVFLNRLKKRMPLESCVTVEYALGMKKKQLTTDDLAVPSPFNTYLHAGLPPGPVGNPGLAALRAALAPAQTDYLFFVAQGDGRHVFSKTWAEHKLAKKKIRRARKIK